MSNRVSANTQSNAVKLEQMNTKPTTIQKDDFRVTDFPGANFDSGNKLLGNLDHQLLLEDFP